MSFDPWGPIQSALSDLNSSDATLSVVSVAGLPPDRPLTEREDVSERTRVRAYLQMTSQRYVGLDDGGKRRFVVNAARHFFERVPQFRDRINDTLRRIGWEIFGGELVALDLIDAQDLAHVPEESRPDLLKAATRVGNDPSGAITAACGAIDILTEAIYNANPALGNPADTSFQERVNRSLQAIGGLERYRRDLTELSWTEERANLVVQNMRQSISQAAVVMGLLRSNMGDAHGTAKHCSGWSSRR